MKLQEPEIPEPILLTIDDVSWLLQISKSTVRRYIQEKKIRAVHPSEKIIRVPRVEVERFARELMK